MKGVPADEGEVDPERAGCLDGDRGITYAAAPPENTADIGRRLVAGRTMTSPPLVSFEPTRFAAGPASSRRRSDVTVNVLGREIGATIANCSRPSMADPVDQLGHGLFADTFRGAPFTSLATLPIPTAAPRAEELAFLKEGVAPPSGGDRGPGQGGASETANGIVEQIGWGCGRSVTLFASMLVLGWRLCRRPPPADPRRGDPEDARRRGPIGASTSSSARRPAIFGLDAPPRRGWRRPSMDAALCLLRGPALGAAALRPSGHPRLRDGRDAGGARARGCAGPLATSDADLAEFWSTGVEAVLSACERLAEVRHRPASGGDCS